MTACLLVLVVLVGTPASARLFSFSDFKGKGAERGMRQLVRHQDSIEHTPAQEAFDELEKVLRSRRQAGGHPPQTQGQFNLSDSYQYARIHYSGDSSLAIFVLTYNLDRRRNPVSTHLYSCLLYTSPSPRD